jgi:hypothetical protein
VGVGLRRVEPALAGFFFLLFFFPQLGLLSVYFFVGIFAGTFVGRKESLENGSSRDPIHLQKEFTPREKSSSVT